jgi:uncharacterized protein YwqG
VRGGDQSIYYGGGRVAYVDEETPIALRAKWTLLLQLDSCKAAGMRWGDHGRLHFSIRTAELAKGRFNRTWVILQTTRCGLEVGD